MFFTPVPSAFVRRSSLPQYRSLDRSLEQFLNRMGSEPAHSARQFTQTDNGWVATLDIPGVAREQLQVGIEGQVIRIETLPEAPRSFKVAYEMPQDIDAAASEAKLENGVLTLTLIKKVQAANVVTLAVK